jgi:hypothetical protein
MDTMPENVIRVLRTGFPNSIKDKLYIESPMGESLDKIDHYETKQSIHVYDPRLVLGDPSYYYEKEDKVIVSRIQSHIPIYKETDPSKRKSLFYIQVTKTLEVLKEYTFEEWDKGLVWEDTK